VLVDRSEFGELGVFVSGGIWWGFVGWGFVGVCGDCGFRVSTCDVAGR